MGGPTAAIHSRNGSEELTLVLEEGTASECTAIAFESGPGVDLAEMQKQLASLGINSEVRSDSARNIADAGVQRSRRTADRVVLAVGFQRAGRTHRGLAADRLGHVAIYTPEPERTSKFYSEVLGFRVSDWIEENFVFMRCGSDHHTHEFRARTEARIHHIAFELRDASHMHRACDLLGRRKIQILWGPVRHGPGHNVAVYHHNPDRHLIELYYSIDLMLDEELGYFEPQPWHRDRPQRPKTGWDFRATSGASALARI